jgi:hypothetical protein
LEKFNPEKKAKEKVREKLLTKIERSKWTNMA